MNVNNIKLNFLDNTKIAKSSVDTVNIIFYNKKNEICSIPEQFDNKTISVLKNKKFLDHVENLSFFRSEFGSFLLIKNFSNDVENKNQLKIENLGGTCFQALEKNNFKKVNVYLDDIKLSAKFIYGFCLRSYKFENYKSNKKKIKLQLVNLISSNFKKIKKEFSIYESLISGGFFTRDLVWKPANILCPKSFANECKTLSKNGVKVKIYNETQLKKIE